MPVRIPRNWPNLQATLVKASKRSSSGRHDGQHGTDAPAKKQQVRRTVGDVFGARKNKYGTIRVGDPTILF